MTEWLNWTELIGQLVIAGLRELILAKALEQHFAHCKCSVNISSFSQQLYIFYSQYIYRSIMRLQHYLQIPWSVAKTQKFGMSFDPLECGNSFYFLSLSQECQKVVKRGEMILKDFCYLYKNQGYGSEETEMLSGCVWGNTWRELKWHISEDFLMQSREEI